MDEKLTDEEAEKMIKEIDVDDAQQSRLSIRLTGGMSPSDSAGANFGTNRGKNRGSCADHNTRARADSHGEADR